MLKFWKKSNSKEKHSESPSSSPSKSARDASSSILATGYSDIDLNQLLEMSRHPSSEETSFSRLSKPLVELIRDPETLTYFIQYLETINITNLAKCLVDIDHFNSMFATSSNSFISWKDVKGFSVDVEEETNGVKFSFANEIGYKTHVACDISRNCDVHSKTNCGCGRTRVRSVSEAKLTEMRKTEESLVGLIKAYLVSQATVDALQIFSKYFCSNAPFTIILPKLIFERLVGSLSQVSDSTFCEVRQYIFSILEKEFFNEFLRSEFHCKYQIAVLTGTKVHIADILYNESALFYFMEFLEQEGARGLLECWMAVNNFQEQYDGVENGYDPLQAQNDAMVLYERYFSLQATQPLHLGDKVRFAVEENICREPGPLPTCFVIVKSLITKILDIKFLPSFLQSQLYFNFLSELISTVNSGPNNSIRSGGSDCSSDVSISLTNNSQSSEITNSKRGTNSESGSLSIDSSHLYDPDSLWRRSKRSGLTFGRVNPLGRFETEVEPEPDRKLGIETRISKAMKRLVNIEEDKTKEEMAWQVAEMIVKDVTSLTMPDNHL